MMGNIQNLEDLIDILHYINTVFIIMIKFQHFMTLFWLLQSYNSIEYNITSLNTIVNDYLLCLPLGVQ